MNNNIEAQFDFCLKCGALARDGVCTSCGFGKEKSETEVPSTVPLTEVETPVSYTNPNANPYVEYQSYNAYTYSAIPADVQVKKKNGKVWAIVGVCIGIVVLLIVLLCVAVWQLVSKIDSASSNYEENFWDDYIEDDYDYDYGYDYDDDYDYDYGYDYSYDEYEDDNSLVSPDGKTYGYDPEDDYYYQLKDIIREDLTYSVYFDYEEFTEGEDAYVYCSYPVLEGDIPNIDYLNEVIYDEYLYFVDYYTESIKEFMSEGDYYYALSEGYVTYMDEDKISIVFQEESTSDVYSYISLYCINIDVKNGVVIDNTEILDANDDFSVDFRLREAEQNQSDTLDYYTDQEITEMLNDSENLIVFYTPLGLEVGLNHDFGWSTTTYKDYEKYLKQF